MPQRTMVLMLVTLLAALDGCSQPAPPPAAAAAADVMTAAVDDVPARLAGLATVRLTADLSVLSAKERQMLPLLIDAANEMDGIYWQQSWGDSVPLLDGVGDNTALRRLLAYNYGPWDKLDDFKPLVSGVPARPPGGALYPADVTAAELDALPLEQRRNAYSMVRRDAAGKLLVVPYSQAFAAPLQRAAGKLRAAAALCEDAAFKRFLLARADALVSDNYRASDLDWMDSKSSPLDLIIGAVEDYEDNRLGVRTAFEGHVLLKDLAWSARLARFTRLLPAMQRGLPVPAAYKREQPGTDSELNAYDVLLYTGEANTSAKVIAINLPNDEAVQKQKGTRRLQLKNTMQAKFDRILVPIAGELLDPAEQAHIRFDAFFANTMFHEVAHGLGIRHTLDGKGTVRAALKESYSPLEEAKADILGLYLVTRLIEMQELKDTTIDDHYITFVAGILRSVRFSAADAHGQANMLEFNWFIDHGAVTRDAASSRYHVDVPKARAAAESLAARIIQLQGDGAYAATKAALAAEGIIRPQLMTDLARLRQRNIPVDIVFEQGKSVLGLE
jgi:Peptidase family M49